LVTESRGDNLANIDHKDQIGFLPVARTIEFDGGKFIPLSKFPDALAGVKGVQNQDGFVYPPLAKEVKMPADARWEDVPNTERPALLHKLPPSHDLVINESPINGNLRANDGAFLLHLAAYLHGVRLQFHDWWFDGRVPIKSTYGIIVKPGPERDFFSHAYRTWKSWPDEARLLFTNILYMNSRSPSHEWDWERFTINYMVFDACYKLARIRCKIKANGHADRLKKMCQYFTLAVETHNLNEIYRLRNPIFHEALWDGSQPCTAVSDSAFMQVDNLRRLNQRLIPALLNYSTDYIGTSWSSFSPCIF
jgi:hypothetical protein